jgi:hypothetical protein
MRKIAYLALFLAMSASISAQKNKDKNPNLPSFGDVSKSDLEMKDCDFDPKAPAIILVDDGELEYVFGKGGELKRRIRIKILNSNGLDWANVHLPYFSQARRQEILGLEAQTYNLDASGKVVVSRLDKKLIYDKKLDKKNSEKVFTFPDVKVGSIIEYKFRHTGVSLITWYFQRSIPVRYSHFTIDFPEELEVAAIPYCNRTYEYKTDAGTRVVKKYAMSNVPGLRDEPYVLNEDFYRDRLETKLVAYTLNGKRENQIVNWKQVIKALMEDEDFGVQIKKNIPRTSDLDQLLATKTTAYDRMKCIYKYVQSNMDWNEYLGIWALDGVRSAWKDKKGTVGEINLILVNLLKDAGFHVYPVLVRTHENGVVNTLDAGTYDVPGYYQFDRVMAYVELDGRVYVLDATQKDVPAHLMPANVLMTQGLVIEKLETNEWGWKTLWNDKMVARNTFVIKGAIDDKGTMTGQMDISSQDYARLTRLDIAKKGKEKYIEKYISKSNGNLKVEDVSFENLESDSLPLVQKIKFSQPLNAAGEYQYFSTNLLTGLEENPFVADNRFSDVFFGCNQSYAIYGYYTLPEGYEFDELPKNIKMIMPDTSIAISRISQVSGSMLQLRLTIDFKKPYYPAAQYGELHEFYLRLFDILNEQYVIRKKSAQP